MELNRINKYGRPRLGSSSYHSLTVGPHVKTSISLCCTYVYRIWYEHTRDLSLRFLWTTVRRDGFLLSFSQCSDPSTISYTIIYILYTRHHHTLYINIAEHKYNYDLMTLSILSNLLMFTERSHSSMLGLPFIIWLWSSTSQTLIKEDGSSWVLCPRL